MTFDEKIRRDFLSLIRMAKRVSSDLGEEVSAVLRLGKEQPLSPGEAERLITRVIEIVRGARAKSGGGEVTLDLDQLAAEILEEAKARGAASPTDMDRCVVLADGAGVTVGPLHPVRVFHGRTIPMNEGVVKTSEIDLWEENERLDIHVQQFRKLNGRPPTDEELVDLMLSRMQMPGSQDNEFEIRELANSIAVNGVRVAPILSYDGRLLDGNRRVAACHLILNSRDYTPDQKARVEYLYVWMLTAHATEDDENAVVVSLNFEDDGKLEWPSYIKARKIHEAWVGMVAREGREPGPRRAAELKKTLSVQFALGPDTTEVNRLLKMMSWALDFEEHHINERGRDPFEVRHHSGQYFEYFDELSKGGKPGGVAHTLEQDDNLKKLAFDLLYQGKFKSFRLVRNLKYVPDSPEVVETLQKLRDRAFTTTDDLEQIRDDVEDALALCNANRAEARQLGANQKVAAFVKFLRDLPVGAFSEILTEESLLRLLEALRLVEPEVEAMLRRKAKA